MEKEKTRNELIAESLLEHEQQGPNFLTYTARPKYVEQIETFSDFSPDGGKDTAILVCGPMVYENHFTRDTIRLYRKHYPETLIILSTWDDEDEDYLEDLRGGNVVVLTSPKPGNPGVGNSNIARITFRIGLEEAKQNDIVHVFRTSTMQRIHASNVLMFLQGMIKSFPLKRCDQQKERIIASSYGSLKYVPFSIFPMFMYGHIEDLLMYWDKIPDTRELSPSTDENETVRMRMQSLSRCYFTKRYLEKLGVSFRPDSIQDYWEIISERFVLLDREMLDIYWYMPSISPLHAQERRQFPYTAKNTQSITFKDWLVLYHTQGHHPTAPEWILDTLWGENCQVFR